MILDLNSIRGYVKKPFSSAGPTKNSFGKKVWDSEPFVHGNFNQLEFP